MFQTFVSIYLDSFFWVQAYVWWIRYSWCVHNGFCKIFIISCCFLLAILDDIAVLWILGTHTLFFCWLQQFKFCISLFLRLNEDCDSFILPLLAWVLWDSFGILFHYWRQKCCLGMILLTLESTEFSKSMLNFLYQKNDRVEFKCRRN